MTREEAAVYIAETFEWVMREYENHRADRTMMQKTTEAFDMAIAALRQPGWVRTADRLPEGDEHDGILGLYNGPGYLLYDSVRIGWLRSHPEMYVYWTHLPKKPEVEG